MMPEQSFCTMAALVGVSCHARTICCAQRLLLVTGGCKGHSDMLWQMRADIRQKLSDPEGPPVCWLNCIGVAKVACRRCRPLSSQCQMLFCYNALLQCPGSRNDGVGKMLLQCSPYRGWMTQQLFHMPICYCFLKAKTIPLGKRYYDVIHAMEGSPANYDRDVRCDSLVQARPSLPKLSPTRLEPSSFSSTAQRSCPSWQERVRAICARPLRRLRKTRQPSSSLMRLTPLLRSERRPM